MKKGHTDLVADGSPLTLAVGANTPPRNLRVMLICTRVDTGYKIKLFMYFYRRLPVTVSLENSIT